MPNLVRSRGGRIALWAFALLALAGLAAALQRPAARPAPTIDDPAFVSAANRLCARTVPELRETREDTGREGRSEAETARAVERATDGLGQLVARLRTLEQRPESEPEITAWLQRWDAYIDAGRRYAAAVRRGNPDEYARVDDQSVAPLKAIARFARANRIDACVP